MVAMRRAPSGAPGPSNRSTNPRMVATPSFGSEVKAPLSN